LGIGTGAIVWVEQYLPSSFVAVFAAASPIGLLFWIKGTGVSISKAGKRSWV
jgi:hypothetical protein